MFLAAQPSLAHKKAFLIAYYYINPTTKFQVQKSNYSRHEEELVYQALENIQKPSAKSSSNKISAAAIADEDDVDSDLSDISDMEELQKHVIEKKHKKTVLAKEA